MAKRQFCSSRLREESFVVARCRALHRLRPSRLPPLVFPASVWTSIRLMDESLVYSHRALTESEARPLAS